MATVRVPTVLAQGTGLSTAAVTQVQQLETQQAEGTQMEWIWTCRAVTVPAIHLGPITIPQVQIVSGSQLAQGFATLLNALARPAQALAGIQPWPGQPLAVATGAQVRIRWVKGAVWSPQLIAALAGIGTAALGLLTASGIGDAMAALITAVIVGLGVYVAIQAWQLIAWVVQTVGNGLRQLAASPAGPWLALAALVAGIVLVWDNM